MSKQMKPLLHLTAKTLKELGIFTDEDIGF